MNLRAFLGLALATVLVVIATVIAVTTRGNAPATRAPGTILLGDLAKSADNAAKIVWTRAGETTTIVKTGPESWTVNELSNYPAFKMQIDEAVVGASRFMTFEPKTARPELYDKLDLGDPTTKEAKSSRLQIYDASGKQIGDVIVGRVKSAMTGQESIYVRLPNEPRAWLVKGKVELPTARNGWVDTTVLHVDLPRVREATLNTPAKPTRVRVFKSTTDERDFTIEGMPADYETKDIFGAEDVARVIQQLNFEDVKPASQVPLDTSGQPWAEFVTWDGLKIDLWLTEADGKSWAAVKASMLPDATGVKSEEKPEGDKDALAKEVAETNSRTGGWVYAVPSYELGHLRKTLDDLIQPKPKS
ncbi:MAG TPA: DUF4340 domain-containing protein [Alphaproteobacteria bacterium]|nr:DUF4340 domain-containing protein [Alphaproteobacteria bacterium]